MQTKTRNLTLVSNVTKQHHVSIEADHGRLPIEISIIGKFPRGAGKFFVESATAQQALHPEFVDEFNETSALIGKTNFAANDPTAIYSFGVDTRDLVFHRHAGHRVITGVTGEHGSILKFSTCTPEEAQQSPMTFLEKMVVIHIPADRMFTLRFNGTIYHQFCPVNYNEKAFLAVSAHTNEAGGLSGELLEKILENKGSIPLLTEPAPDSVMTLLSQENAYELAKNFYLDI
jgi:hypothetical protein